MKIKLLLFAFFLTVSSLKAQTFTIGDYTYSSLGTTPKSVQVTSAACKAQVTIQSSVVFDNETYIVTRIGNNVFENCTSLTDLSLPDSITSIGEYAFSNATNLENFSFPSNLQSISIFAFSNCTKLTSLTIPNSVTSIKERAFKGCENLTEVNLSNNLTTINKEVFRYCEKLTNIAIPDNITKIGEYAFSDCDLLGEVTFDANSMLVEIEEAAFQNCAIQNIALPNITTLGSSVFRGSSITEVNLPNSITTLGDRIYESCSALTNIVNLPNQINKIPEQMFEECTNLETVVIPSHIIEIEQRAFKDCSKLSSVTIPNSVTTIGSFTFENTTGLLNIELPNSITSISERTFNKSGLQNIVLPNSLTSIGKSAFKECTNLTSIAFPSSLNTLGWTAFESSGLTNVTIPNTITNIDYGVFNSCENLTVVNLDNDLALLGENMFEGCVLLENIDLPDSLEILPYGIFRDCVKLKNIDLPETLEEIKGDAFRNCTDLAEINLPNAITNIDNFAFHNCTSLVNVDVNWQSPLDINSLVFNWIDLSVAILQVPTNTKYLYEAANVWKDFGTINEEATTGNTVAIPDANFEQYLIDQNIDSDGTINGSVLKTDIENVPQVIITGKNISNLTGIQDFTNLTELNAANNQLTGLDLSKNLLLEKLYVANNQLTTIDLSKNSKLINLDVGENSLTKLEVHLLVDLETLTIYKNQLTDINIYSNKELLTLIANENQLTNVDIRENKNLFWIDVDDNDLYSLTIKNENNTKITTFSATGNPNLTCIEVDDVSFSNTNWTDLDATATFSTDCAPSNDDCSSAIPLVFGQETPGDIISGNANNSPTCAANTVLADVWFSVTIPDSGEFSVVGTGFGGSIKFALYESCSAANAIACGENISLNNLTVGSVYYLKVWLVTPTGGRTTSGTFNLTASDSSVLSVDNFTIEKSDLIVFPNPANTNISLSSSSNLLIQNVEIFTVLGDRIITKKRVNKMNVNLDVSNLTKGIYFVRAKTDKEVISKKIIIK